MRYGSTRGGDSATLDQALCAGLAADGGLYIPERLPRFTAEDFAADATPAGIARRLLEPFFEGSSLRPELDAILEETLTFPLPLAPLGDTSAPLLLELFHGPTAAFKDVGAGFLAACLTRLEGDPQRPLTVLVATSGDTGGAVAAAFNERRGVRVAVLFPQGRVSARQAHQLSCWGDNVLSLAVRGSFDDCQALVKRAMGEPALASSYRFTSANSINIGRLLPQCIYYADAALARYRATGRRPGFIVPAGNLGNALACLLVRAMGLPVGEVVLATNSNRVIVDYLESGEWVPAASVETLANAMDVGNPSNMERARALGGNLLKGRVRAWAASDADIEAEIRQSHRDWGRAVCPHTATALHAWRKLPPGDRSGSEWIVAATAHPAKFEETVERLIGETLALPPALQSALSKPARAVTVEASLASLESALREAFPP